MLFLVSSHFFRAGSNTAGSASKVVIRGGKVVAPTDPEPLIMNGPRGLWDEHIAQHEGGVIGTTYAGITPYLFREVREELQELLGDDYPVMQDIIDSIVRTASYADPLVVYGDEKIRYVTGFVKLFCHEELATKLGAVLLNFDLDENMEIYHSTPDIWQRGFGYNEFYDYIFDLACDMLVMPIIFDSASGTYGLWTWKGEYWNLHSGGEIGLYKYTKDIDNMEHFYAVDFEMPMTLSLYYYNPDNYNTINMFNWEPVEEQWWITGFTGQIEEFKFIPSSSMILVGSVDFSEHPEIYEGLKEDLTENRKYREKKKYFIFDDASKVVWIHYEEGIDY